MSLSDTKRFKHPFMAASWAVLHISVLLWIYIVLMNLLCNKASLKFSLHFTLSDNKPLQFNGSLKQKTLGSSMQDLDTESPYVCAYTFQGGGMENAPSDLRSLFLVLSSPRPCWIIYRETRPLSELCSVTGLHTCMIQGPHTHTHTSAALYYLEISNHHNWAAAQELESESQTACSRLGSQSLQIF